MAQKIQFIASVLNRPELLILDEPFTGLDPVNAEVIKDAVLDLKKAGTTVVFSTHDMGVAERLCDRIFMIFKGRKVLDGTLDEIQSAYGHDTIRLRTEDGVDALAGLDGIEEINDQGNVQEVRWRGDPQALLAALMARTRVTLFEVARPSLHDIFVRIAAPETPDRQRWRSRPMRPDLRKIWVVASTEFGSAIRTKSFIIGLLLLPMIMGASILLATVRRQGEWTPGRGPSPSSTARASSIRRSRRRPRRTTPQSVDARGQGDPAPDRAVVDQAGTGSIASLVLELSDRIRRGELDAFVVIPAEAIQPPPPSAAKPPTLEYHSDNPNDDVVRNWLIETVNAEVRIAAVPLGRHRPGRRRPFEPARHRSTTSAWSIASAATAGGAAAIKAAEKVDPVRTAVVPAVADVRHVLRDHDQHPAAPEQRDRGEDEQDQRGAARLDHAVRADDGQAAGQRRDRAGDWRRSISAADIAVAAYHGYADVVSSGLVAGPGALPGPGDLALWLAVHGGGLGVQRAEGRPVADDARHAAVDVPGLRLDGRPAEPVEPACRWACRCSRRPARF